MFQDFDMVKHRRAKRRVVAALLLVGVCWGGAWHFSWQAAVLGALANVYLGLAFWFAIWMYPEKEE